MSTFFASVEIIDKIWKHSNADRLEVASLRGMAYQFCIGKGQYKEGDKILYLPLDSVLPPNLIARLGVGNFLAGAEKNRIKTCTLRGEISQGLAVSLDNLPQELWEATPEEITQYLGITKYEPPANFVNDGILYPLPTGQGKYDIEGGDRFPNIIDLLLDIPVYITEKLEGMNFSITRRDSSLFVNMRENTIVEIEGSEHTFWKVAREQGLLEFINKLEGEDVVVYGEFIGEKSQGNIYKLRGQQVRLFDIKINHKFLSPPEFIDTLERFYNKQWAVPCLVYGKTLREELGDKSLREYANGHSELNFMVKREGVVIKPMQEQMVPAFGRLVLKQHSPEYLANQK